MLSLVSHNLQNMQKRTGQSKITACNDAHATNKHSLVREARRSTRSKQQDERDEQSECQGQKDPLLDAGDNVNVKQTAHGQLPSYFEATRKET